MTGFRGRYRNKRDANEPLIVAALEAHGFVVVRLDTPVDLVVSRKGETWLCEVKNGNAELKEHQAEFLDRWQGKTAVLRSVEDVQELARVAK